MKALKTATVVSALTLAAGLAQGQTPQVEFPAASPASTLKQRVGVTDIEVTYSRPGVKERKIFGGLVPYGEVWRTGANAATKLVLSTPVRFNGTEVAAGTYGLFTIPGEKEWTIILNDPQQWGAYAYDATKDVVRIKATPVALAEPVETFTIDVGDLRDDSAALNLSWERTRVPVRLEVDLVAALVPQIEAAMANPGEKAPYFQSAMFYLDHGLDLAKAAAWIDKAIAAEPDAFYFVYHKARILAKQGDKAGAIAAARKSIEVATRVGGRVRDEYVRLNEALIASLR